MKNPSNNPLNRSLDSEIQEVLSAYSSFIEEMVNFGCKILEWDMERTNLVEEDLPAHLFIRNFIGEIDGISILMQKSSIEPCKNLLRTALENVFYLEYLHKDDNDNRRALCFLFWNSWQKSKLIKKHNGKSEHYNTIKQTFNSDRILKETTPPVIPDIEKHREDAENFQSQEKFKLIKDEFLEKGKKIKYWYSAFDGPKSIELLAKNVELPALYEVLYRGYSGSVHGTNIISGRIGINTLGHFSVQNLRFPNLNEIHSITLNSFNLCNIVYSTYISSKIPERRDDYISWYNSFKTLIIE